MRIFALNTVSEKICIMSTVSIFTSSDWILPFRIPILTKFLKLTPLLVGEMFFLTVVFLGYWAINKRFFRFLGCCVCAFTIFNNVLKVFFAIPRPTIERLVPLKDPFGFPSGDIQIATIFWGLLCLKFPSKGLRALTSMLLLTIGFSRIYLGAHSLLDVLGGFFIGAMGCWLLWYFYRKDIKIRPFVQMLLVFGYIVFSFLYLNKENYLYSYVLGAGGFWLSCTFSSIFFRYSSNFLLSRKMIAIAYSTTICLRVLLPKTPLALFKNDFLVAFLLGLYALWLFQFLANIAICSFLRKTALCRQKP